MARLNSRWLRRAVCLHPVLLTLFLPLFFYRTNINEVFPREFLPILAMACVQGAALCAASLLICSGRVSRASLLSSCLILIASLYQNIALALGKAFPAVQGFITLQGDYLTPATVFSLMAAAALACLRRQPSIRVHLLFCVLGAVLCAYSAVPIIAHGLPRYVPHTMLPVQEMAHPTVPTERLPHIVYIVPDRYPGGETLRNDFSYDNSPFYRALQEKGFYVAEPSFANYTKTFQSLGSMFNMQYLHFLTQEFGANNSSYLPVYHMMQNHAALQVLHRAGYSYLHMGNWWNPTRVNYYAQENFSGNSVLDEMSELQRSYVMHNILPAMFIGRLDSSISRSCNLIKAQQGRVVEAVQRDEPQFIFWHLLMPHPPFIVDRNGTCLPREIEEGFAPWDERNARFIDQVIYTNQLLLETFNAVKGGSNRDFIFIIQSDEGPFPRIYVNNDGLDWTTVSEQDLRTKYGIINAFYFSDGDYGMVKDVRTPINNFRILLNKATGTDLPMLPHRAYMFRFAHLPYRFHDITDVLISTPPAKGKRLK